MLMAHSITCYVPTNLVVQTALPAKNTPTDMTEAYITPPEDIDSTCMKAVCAGDQSALAQIVERWQVRLINFFYRSTGNRADAEDLTQETFIELNRSASRYHSQGSFKAFIFTMARRRLIDNYRKKSRRPIEYVDPSEFLMQCQSEKIDHNREIEEIFHCALSTLPDKQRCAILLLQQQGLSYEEIALSLDASLSAVKTWIHRARTHLRKELKEFIKD